MVIASRTLEFRRGAEQKTITIELYAPQRGSKGSWSCRYKIDWPEQASDGEVFGFDSMQALFLTLQTIGAEIYSSNYHKAGQLRWGDAKDGYGFPVVPTYRNLLVGADAKYL
jgi:hypothetical protein